MPVIFFWPIMATYFYREWVRECQRIVSAAEAFPVRHAEILLFPERRPRQ